jgi:hypothetical protein
MAELVRFEAFTAVTMKNVVFWDVALHSAATCPHRFFARGFSTLKMEAICSSEKSVNTRPTQPHIPEDNILHGKTSCMYCHTKYKA